MGDLSLNALLDELGYGGDNEGAALETLYEAGLTRPGRQRIAERKREEVERALGARFALICAPCQKEGERAADRRVLVPARQTDCGRCGGSANRVAVDRLCRALHAQGIHKVVVVGGSPSAHKALAALVGGRLQLRLVDGVTRRTKAEARTDLLWADRVIVWGSTQLDHKVSTLYTDSGDDRVIAVHKRGIAALASEFLRRG